MEIIIIVLIAVEAALAIIREYHDVAELVRSLFRTADDPEVTPIKGELQNDRPHFGDVVETAVDESTGGTSWTEGRRLV